MMVLAKTEKSSSFATAADLTAIKPHHHAKLLPSLSRDTEAPSPAVVADLRISSYTSRKRNRAVAGSASSMEARRKKYARGYDDGATTTISRSSGSSGSSRRPDSARHASVQYEDEDSLSRLQLRRRIRPSSAIRAGYLGVSSIAFAPPLSRYLNSPQHGRHALRSSRPTSSTPRVHSRSGPFGVLAGPAAATTAERARQTTSWRGEELEGRGTASGPVTVGYYDTPWCPLTLSAEPQGFPERTVGMKSCGDLGVVGMHETPEISPPPGFLTPVGPDWLEGDCPPPSSIVDTHRQVVGEVARCDAASDPSTALAGRYSVDGSVPVYQPSLQEKEQPSGVDEVAIVNGNERIGNTGDSDSRHSSRYEQCAISSCGERSCDTRQEGQPTNLKRRNCRHRRQIPRRTAWDLLTGRRIGRHRRKGSGDIHLPAVNTGTS